MAEADVHSAKKHVETRLRARFSFLQSLYVLMKAKVVAASPVCLTMNAPVDILKISIQSSFSP